MSDRSRRLLSKAPQIAGLTSEEIDLLQSLVESGVRFMVVGMGAAILQSAPGVTQDIDLWFAKKQIDLLSRACERAGATYYWRTNPPGISGPGIDQVDVVWNCDGLHDFEEEYEQAVDVEIVPGLPVKVLPLERILASKRAAGRPKDKAAIPMLKNAIKSLRKTE
jgi:predicted nucleotidyltransferase